ncbi:MAG: DUF4276 family protein [Chloroflexi bacterium]|nr:DUF4276 family protein [Chloroflexota bacterium]
MVKPIRIYYEGDGKLRQGFRKFFDSICPPYVKLSLVACGPTANTVADFMTAMDTHSDSTNLLLIDSDGPDDGKLAANVRNHSKWDSSVAVSVTDDQLHFMVQVMEAWFLADRQCLRSYYGQDFRENRLPGNPKVEEILKDDVLNGLENATRGTKRGKYHKTRHAPRLLAQIDVDKVRAASPACARLFSVLKQLVSQA